MVEWSFTNLVVVGANPVAVSLFVLEKPRFFIVYLTGFGRLSQRLLVDPIHSTFNFPSFPQIPRRSTATSETFPGESFTFEL